MANLAPPLKFTAWDSSGNPLAGGKLYTYVAGTTTPKATYTDSGLGTPNANPVILNSRGEASVWLSGAYQLVLKDASDVTIYSQDNVTDALTNSTISGTLTISSTAVTWSGNPTHSGNHTFSGNVSVQGNTTLGNATTDSSTINGSLTINGPTSASTPLIVAASVAGGTITTRISNTDNTNTASNARFLALSGGASGGDPITEYQVSGIQSWAVGIDNSDSDTFKIDASGTLGSSTNWLNIKTDGRLYGTALHNNAGAVTGTTNQYIASGTWTPTTTNVSNIDSSSASAGQWTRVGNVVTWSLEFSVNATSASTSSEVGISLPIASNFTSTAQCVGTAAPVVAAVVSGFARIVADATNDRMSFLFTSGSDTGNSGWYATGSYVVV